MANDVNMTSKPQPKKTSWNAEEVNNIVVQYQNQIQQYEQYMQAMQNQIKELEIDGIIKRVDILFKVLKQLILLPFKLVILAGINKSLKFIYSLAISFL